MESAKRLRTENVCICSFYPLPASPSGNVANDIDCKLLKLVICVQVPFTM